MNALRSLSVVVVEDHDLLRQTTVEALAMRGHALRGVGDGEALDEALAAQPADVVVLDIHLPGENGYAICRRLRAASPQLGIVMLTALAEVERRVQGYDEGADVYLTKPSSNEELAAAVARLGRRLDDARPGAQGLSAQTQALSLQGPLGRESLTEAEMRLLRGLALAANRQLETWQLLELLGLDDGPAGKSALEVRIVRLRRKLVAVGAAEPAIKSLRRVGYQLAEPVQILG